MSVIALLAVLGLIAVSLRLLQLKDQEMTAPAEPTSPAHDLLHVGASSRDPSQTVVTP
jgi:hypothetical protein